MRTLEPAPPRLFHPTTAALSEGSFVGPLPPFSPGRAGRLTRALSEKAWLYAAIVSDEVWISLCVVHLGYAATAFVFAYELGRGRMLLDSTAIAPPFRARVSRDLHAGGDVASFRGVGLTVRVERVGGDVRGDGELVARAEGDGVDLSARLSCRGAPRAVSAVAALSRDRFNTTEKRAPLEVTGRARFAGRAFSLDGALGGYDFTRGLLARRTRWRWAFGLGRVEGAPFAFNLVSGFVGEAECVAFGGGRTSPLSEATIDLDPAAPHRPWRVTGEGYALDFTPGAIHAQRTNLGVVRSRFLQPVGVYDGAFDLDGRRLALEGLPGVIEDQDVVW